MVLGMRTAMLLLACAALAGCDDPVKDAETELNMMKSAQVSADEMCLGEQKVAKAMLEAHDDRFTMQKQIADQTCTNAELEKAVLLGR